VTGGADEREARLAAMTRWQRFAERHDTDEDPRIWWSSIYDPPRPQWRLMTSSSWLRFEFGVSIDREYGERNWPDWWQISIAFGPWGVGLIREWNHPDSREWR
jgi:hypothetical protein